MATPKVTENQEPELNQLAQWENSGKKGALATVVSTWGSSPRPVGSHLAIDEKGNFVGSVSGGCIEGAVVTEALDVIKDGKARRLEFGVSNDQAWEVGLSCGGSIHVYIEIFDAKKFAALLDACLHRHTFAQITRLKDGRKTLLRNDVTQGDLPLNSPQLTEAKSLLLSARSAMLNASDQPVFVRSYIPPFRMIIVGAVHITQALAPMARLAGYEVIIVDPRKAFGCTERFPDDTLSHDWPDDALESLRIDNQTAIITLSHDPKIDDAALYIALKSVAFYIGCLGSRRTHATRIKRLTHAGLGDYLERIKAPVGINLGGRAPAEIAVSILAQVIQARYHQEAKKQ